MAQSKKIMLKSSDDVTFEVEEPAAELSQTIKHMIDDNCAENVIPLVNVDAKTLAKVVEYCKKHGNTEEPPTEKELKAFDTEFVNQDVQELLELVLAANYLDIKCLLNLASTAVANYIKDKSPEEVREIFHIQNDYTPEEEAEVRKEHAWVFEEE